MFNKAVQNHAVQSKPQQAIQKPLPSSRSSGLPGNRTISAARAGSGLSNSSALRPSGMSTVNTGRLTYAEAPIAQKRKYNSGLERTLTNENSFSEQPAFLDLPPSGQSGSLQDAVYFDENDFDDDDFSLDFEQPTSKTTPPKKHSERPAKDHLMVHSSSSVALPWSQSPLEHLTAHSGGHQSGTEAESPTDRISYPSLPRPRNKPTAVSYPNIQSELRESPTDRISYPSLPRPQNKPTAVSYPNIQSELRELNQDDDLPAPQAPKRRKLPWNKQGAQPNDAPLKTPSKMYTWQQKNIKDRKIQKLNPEKRSKQAVESDYTPLPPDNNKSAYPWNVTATAVKDEQKALRKQYKPNTKIEAPKEDVATGNQTKKVAPVFLSEEQKKIVSMVVDQNKSVFFTGSAGTGKSVLMREIIRRLREKYRTEADRVAVTASTGLAACNIEGVTLHSFAGIGLGKEDAPELVKKVRKNVKAKTRWLRTKVLIIDEVSMVDGTLFDKLEQIARAVRGISKPFGAIQLVVTGDFFQLPPVPEGNRAATFSFDAGSWNTCVEHTILLTHIFRQRDPGFANMLNEMRVGKLTPKSTEAFKALSRPLHFMDDFEATELFPTRIQVDQANNNKMKKLIGRSYTFTANDSGSIQDPAQRERLLSNCMAPQTLELKKGSQVMLIKNMEDTLVNGSLGKVVAFMDEATWDYKYEQDDDDVDQSQDLEKSDDGEAEKRRLALRRKIYKDPNAKEGKIWPLVQFTLADGTIRRLLCQPESWKIELPNGEVQAERKQVPLILAWALSIHKAQGQTLERVKVDMTKIFEKGQAYVALSRATSQSGLQITGFDVKKVMAHQRVIEFYSDLVTVDVANTRAATSERMPARSYEQGFVDGEDDSEDEVQYLYG